MVPLNATAAKVKAALAAKSPLEKLTASTAHIPGINLDIVESMLASFASAFTQHNRLIKLQIADGRKFPELLLPQSVEGLERLSDTYRYEVTCLSPDAFIPLEELLGKSAQLDIITGYGGLPVSFEELEEHSPPEDITRCGLITAAEELPSDGGFAKYKLVIQAPLALLRHRVTSRVFQDITVPNIVEQIIKEHLHANSALGGILNLKFSLDYLGRYEPRSFCLQYRENDLAFIERILFEEGISYRYEHQPGAVPSVTLVLFDSPHDLPQASQGKVRFHRADATETEDSITEWIEERQIGPGEVNLTSYNYKTVTTHDVAARGNSGKGGEYVYAEASLVDYDPQTLYYGKDANDLERYAVYRQEAHDWEKGCYSGQGNVRQLKAGDWFVLTDHPLFKDKEAAKFVACSVRFSAHNNLPGDLLKYLSGVKSVPAPYRVRFEARRRGLPLTPAYGHTRHARPTAPGIQSALVVGPRNETEVYTDPMGRIKVQFHWQRPKEHPQFGADFDDRSSCWVRVIYPCAGASWGSQYLPRIGQEVLVDFIEDDIDRPIVISVVHNGQQPNPWFSDAGMLPANRTLSGIKTKEFYGEQYGELLFDDTQNQVRTKISSEHGKTQHNQGYLIHPRRDGKGQPRGDGAELRTDNQLAVRAGEGLLLTTEPKLNATGKQVDREQAQAQLFAARKSAQVLGEVAEKQQADVIETGPETRNVEGQKEAKTPSGHLDHMLEAVNAWEAGTNTDPKGETGTEQPGRQPVLLASAAEGMAFATPQEMVLASGSNLDMVTQRDMQQTTVRRWIHNVKSKISLFVQGVADKVNLKLITAKGHALLHAQSGNVEVTADKNVTISANKEKLLAAAGKEFLVTCGGAYIRISGGKIDVHCPGKLSIKAGEHSYTGPTSMDVNAPKWLISEPGKIANAFKFNSSE